MKDIKTLKEDIEHVVKTGEGWTNEIAQWVAEDIRKTLNRQLSSRGENKPRKGYLRLSNLGKPCLRQLYYDINLETVGEELTASTLSKFIFGDLTESYLLGLVKASGHKLEGMQSEMYADGIKGHRDCVIDGMVFDVKSTSSFAFNKFKEHKLRDSDDFGYISQLSSYLYASQDDPLVTNKTHGGFLVMDKQFGHIAVDIYDLSEDVANKPKEIEYRKQVVNGFVVPDRPYEPVRQYALKKGQDPDKPVNMKIPNSPCGYCQHKATCWPEARKFLYSSGPTWLTTVVNEPRGGVFEDKDWRQA